MVLFAYQMFGVGLLFGCLIAFAPWAFGKVIQMYSRLTGADKERGE